MVKMGWIDGNKPEQQVKEDVSSLFVPLQEVAQKRGLKVGVYGKAGSGKTRFALTFPEPIYVLDTEKGSDFFGKLFPNKKIHIADVYQKGKEGEKDEVACFEKFQKTINWITENEKEGTVVIDSGSDLWKFAQTYGKVKIFNLTPEARLRLRFDWGKITNLYEQLLSSLIHSSLNVVITGKVSNKFDSTGQETGETQSRWQKDTEYALDIVMEMQKHDLKDKNVFYATVEKCRANGNLTGKKIDDINYEKLKGLLE
ncbi:MAG: AAA family ATPase [archaeon]|nr:AAA family ATPase [archaeon]